MRKLATKPEQAQRALLKKLVAGAKHTRFGRAHGFASHTSYADFRSSVPVRDYEAYRPYIEQAVAGAADVLWPGKPLYLAKTSGTTSGTKYIPLTRESMKCQVRGARDALLHYIYHTQDAEFLDGKMLFLSGSPTLEKNAAGISVGRLSGISQHFVPAYLQRNRVPTYETNCLEDWAQKVRAIVEETRYADLRLISGIPPWVRMFFEEAQHVTGKTPAALWPNLRLFVQGGVDYSPYRNIITTAFGRELRTVEVYPASEGFIAVQDDPGQDALMLMLDYGIFFEFIPLEAYGKPDAPRVLLWEVEMGRQYAILLTTNAGLWAYDIGDVVKFVSLKPYRIKVTGRVKHFISAFGEHVIEEEVNKALLQAAHQTGATVAEFTVAPFVAPAGSGEPSYHEWFVEFRNPPQNFGQFRELLDASLRELNSYYNDLRSGGMLSLAEVRMLQPDAAEKYMQAIGKLGGQNKFPRLMNTRAVADGIRPYML